MDLPFQPPGIFLANMFSSFGLLTSTIPLPESLAPVTTHPLFYAVPARAIPANPVMLLLGSIACNLG